MTCFPQVVDPDAVLIIFTRYPVPGHVKTRLMGALGAERAAEIQKSMTEFTLAQARKTGAHIQIRFTGGSLGQIRAWLGTEYDFVEQGNGDLGERLERAFAGCFSRGAKAVVVTGCDCPDNRSANLLKCFHLLQTNPCVIGPALDGGYYMIGLNHHQPRLFRNIAWGTKEVLRQTMAAAESCKLLQTLSDVDEPGDMIPQISVIIPALNEAENIDGCLQRVRSGFHIECLVVDGGSTDNTVALAANAGAKILKSIPDRAQQMNLGAKAASGEILLFLHADCQLPDEWDRHVRWALRKQGTSLGYFRFAIREKLPGRRWIEMGTNLRATLFGRPYGDQGLFVNRDTFAALHGYPDIPILEDIRFVQMAKKLGSLRKVNLPLRTSGRRWKKTGLFRTTLLNQLVFIAAAMGADLHKLKSAYAESKNPLRLVFDRNVKK